MTQITVTYTNESHTIDSVTVELTAKTVNESSAYDSNEKLTDDTLFTVSPSTSIEIASEIIFSAPSFDHIPDNYPDDPDTTVNVEYANIPQTASKVEEDFFDHFIQSVQTFNNTHSGVEMELHSNKLGFHTYYTQDASDPTIGWRTAFYGAIYEAMEEVTMDETEVEIHVGKASADAPPIRPEDVRTVLSNHLSNHISWYEVEENAIDAVCDHVYKNQHNGASSE